MYKYLYVHSRAELATCTKILKKWVANATPLLHLLLSTLALILWGGICAVLSTESDGTYVVLVTRKARQGVGIEHR